MRLNDQVIVVTGGAHGIGRALCERFARESPRRIIVADVDFDAARDVATHISGQAVECDVSKETDIKRLVEETEEALGRVDLFCANAGIIFPGGLELTNDAWTRMMDVNFMAHVYAARAVVPGMLRRGNGYLLHTASAAGLLMEMGSAPYTISKHAAVAFAEWLAVMYGDQGVHVSCICSLGVKTAMLETDSPGAEMLRASALDPEAVAECALDAIHEERFLVLPHPEVGEYFRRKGDDHARWLRGMRRLRAHIQND